MVKAVNDAGETHSIADFIILEPTPERVTDTVKVVSIDSIDRQRVCTRNSFFSFVSNFLKLIREF